MSAPATREQRTPAFRLRVLKRARELVALALLQALFPTTAVSQTAPALGVPVDCAIGSACILQNYFDHDPGPAARDYVCGFLSYEGHKGTDIRVIDPEALQRGVAVLAAAPGRVRALRDGMQDIDLNKIGKAALGGKYAGNSVVVEHGGGWESQYAHLREGSVAVRVGDVVERGQKLGLIGLSGFTEFPHLHFEVRRGKTVVDPFTGEAGRDACRPGEPAAGTLNERATSRPLPPQALWSPEARESLGYVPTGVIGAGIAGAPPVMRERTVDRDRTGRFDAASSAALFWVHVFGVQANDREELRLFGPDGRVLAKRSRLVPRENAQWLAYAGMRRRESNWPAGTYRGEYTLSRGEPPEKLVSVTREIRLGAAGGLEPSAPAAVQPSAAQPPAAGGRE
jgi:murein DD-endopeptidase MepM/ murein hydrolase activator NlpD